MTAISVVVTGAFALAEKKRAAGFSCQDQRARGRIVAVVGIGKSKASTTRNWRASLIEAIQTKIAL
jgi:hypothetical protein